MVKYSIGIDPGKEGCIVIIHPDLTREIIKIPKIAKMVDDLELSKIIARIASYESKMVVLEDVHAIYGSAAGSTFTFGDCNGFIRGCLVTNKVPFAKVPPKLWQKDMLEGVPEIIKPMKPGQVKKVRDIKAMAEIAAKRLFPEQDLRRTPKCSKNDDNIIDALLMAEYCRRKY